MRVPALLCQCADRFGAVPYTCEVLVWDGNTVVTQHAVRVMEARFVVRGGKEDNRKPAAPFGFLGPLESSPAVHYGVQQFLLNQGAVAPCDLLVDDVIAGGQPFRSTLSAQYLEAALVIALRLQ